MKRLPLKLVLPLAIVLTSGMVAVFLVTAGARVQTRPAEDFARLVRATAVQPQPRRLAVRAQGSVEPRTQTDLVAETAGRILEVSPSFAAGGFFDQGDLLIRLDATDQEIAVRRAEANYTAAQSRLALAEKMFSRSEALRASGALSDREFDDATNSVALAKAAFIEADATRSQATFGSGPHRDSRPLRGAHPDRESRRRPICQSWNPPWAASTQPIMPKCPLPIPDTDLAFLDLDLGDNGGPPVELRSGFAGQATRLDREKSSAPKARSTHALRMVTVIARVEDPYGRRSDQPIAPLAVGMFVDATIQGRVIPEAVEIPRRALREGDRVLVINDDLEIALSRRRRGQTNA
ncbi:efflux RND transporter periplasmic adaptor subunit [Achromobacter marplatensis]|uniref:efflux RND transporter periplasmic adaptor subunit n=1 Tax=Achromobacter marplatensis TaxID=470868 RepID=UPI003C76D45E